VFATASTGLAANELRSPHYFTVARHDPKVAGNKRVMQESFARDVREMGQCANDRLPAHVSMVTDPSRLRLATWNINNLNGLVGEGASPLQVRNRNSSQRLI